ncbi:MAG: mechanosensitive ion channel [Verrucomicrobia bacterium]|nr:mechanosensitive ion channel [Verrucomicrobiota bacterium]
MDVVIAATPYLVNLAIAIAILLIGKIVAFSIRKLIKKVMTARKIDGTIIGFVAGLVYAIIMVGVVLAALQRIGVQTTSFVAIIGAAGLAIGLALQGSLANFAAGFMLILFKPFKVGNFIEAGGTAGIVEEIDIFTTTLRTPDNRVIIVPNNAITSGAITNVNARDTRRIDLTIGVSYNDDLRAVKDLLLKILDEDERVLKDPAPTVGVLELGDSSVNFCVRPWVKASDFFPTMMDLNMTIKERIEAAGFSIPFPQQDVHLHTVEKS